MIMMMDAVLINVAYIAAFIIRFEGSLFLSNVAQRHLDTYIQTFVTITLMKIVIYYAFGLYKKFMEICINL